jgi:ribosomal protein S18 acetylase RimI-like enzyme
MTHKLDRPAWASLTSRHQHLAQVQGGARRYAPASVPFVATGGDAPEDVAALARLMRPGEVGAFVQADPVLLPLGFVRKQEVDLMQLVATTSFAPVSDERIVPLGRADAADMLELATLTKPGPFTARALDLGRFWGIRRDGRLVAMAGERMSCEGYTELSGVCTHPDARGQGLARLMSRYVGAQISAKGDAVFLHAFPSNRAAVAIYESIGFSVRATLNLVVAERPV